MKRYALIFLIFAFAAATAEAGAGFLKSVEEAKKEAKKKNQLIFVDFFADWCGWCHRFDREVVPAEKFQDAVKNKVLLRVNTEDGKEGTELARQFGVTNLPTFALLTSDMQVVAGMIRGYAPATQFAQELLRLENEYKDFQKRVAAESTVTDPQKRLDLARELHTRRSYAEAEKRLKKLLETKNLAVTVRDPAYVQLAMTSAAQGKSDDAAGALKKLISVGDKGETVEQARYFLSRIYVEQRKWDAALAEMKQFKTLFPKSQYIPSVEFLINQVENTRARGQ